MSNEYLNLVWKMPVEGAERRLVLLTLADYADKDGRCFPSLIQISERCLITKEAASRIISRFISLGYITRLSGGSGRGYKSEYQIHKDALKVNPPTTIKEVLKVDAESTIEDVKVDPESMIGDIKVDPEKGISGEKRLILNGIKVDPGPGPIRKNLHEPPIKKKTTTAAKAAATKGDPLFLIFVEAYTREKGIPYVHTKPDFIQLAACRKRYLEAKWELTTDRWSTGVQHYFASSQHRHTLADLSSRFGDFYKSAADRFGKPASTAESGQRDFTTRNTTNNRAALEEGARLIRERFGTDDTI